MSICSKDTKKKKKITKKKLVKVVKVDKDKNVIVKKGEDVSDKQIEETLKEDVQPTPQEKLNPMIIPDFFNNIRNNYYVANKIIWLTGIIEWNIITEVLRRLNFYNDGTKEPITLYVSSPGGECDAGWALIDMIEKIKKSGTVVRTICAGSCSSMASVILAAGSKGERYAFPSARIMIHQAGIELTGGKLDDMANLTKELKYWTDMTAKYLSKISGKKIADVEKELCYDNYMTTTEAKKFGIIDKVDVFMA